MITHQRELFELFDEVVDIKVVDIKSE